MKAIDSVTIVSGGMDSTTMLHHVVKEYDMQPLVVSFDYGQTLRQELACAAWQSHSLGLEHQVIDIRELAKAMFGNTSALMHGAAVPNVKEVMGDPQPVTYVPHRNLIFLAIAAGIAEARECGTVFYGAQRHDIYGYWDTTPSFVNALNEVLCLNRKTPVTLSAPFVGLDKTGVLKAGVAMDVNYGHTWSCYKGGEKACGTCPTCAERLTAFKNCGIADPLPYEE